MTIQTVFSTVVLIFTVGNMAVPCLKHGACVAVLAARTLNVGP